MPAEACELTQIPARARDAIALQLTERHGRRAHFHRRLPANRKISASKGRPEQVAHRVFHV